MIQSILAIDPGARTGWAVFTRREIGWRLSGAGVVQPTDAFRIEVDHVVIENPQIWDDSNPEAILKLARIVGRYEERFYPTPVTLVRPREWKGTVDGDIMCRRIAAALSPEDAATLAAYKGGYRHNAIDAIGIGKWALAQPFIRRAK